jgi:hypothetical protein
MMRWLIWRELTVMTRTRALWVAMCAQLLVLAAFLIVWGDGVPLMTGNLSAQFATLQAALLLVMLPWVAARVVDDGRTVGLIATIAACPPRHVVAARYLALLLVLFALAASALPLAILALRISAVELWRGWLELPLVFALCTLAAAAATVSVVAGLSRFVAWVIGTTVTLLVAALASPPQAPLVMLAALIITGFAAISADRRVAYLPVGGSR